MGLRWQRLWWWNHHCTPHNPGILGFYLLHSGCGGGVEWVCGGNDCGSGTIAAPCIIQACPAPSFMPIVSLGAFESSLVISNLPQSVSGGTRGSFSSARSVKVKELVGILVTNGVGRSLGLESSKEVGFDEEGTVLADFSCEESNLVGVRVTASQPQFCTVLHVMLLLIITLRGSLDLVDWDRIGPVILLLTGSCLAEIGGIRFQSSNTEEVE
ncbi:hypothetical protein VNO80_09407 [Phaseolus coccineus]|uniref:Uncharacterized protein n=1 Tax=Phaseolus coccineus TaxID=3886 RepID=A0AAN9N650_PHACN